MTHTDSEEKTKNDVYYERNILALGFIRTLVLLLRREAASKEHERPPVFFGWWTDTDSVNEEQWAVVWINGPTGQLGWHIPVSMARDADWLPERNPEYDGYSTQEKNARLERLIYRDFELDGESTRAAMGWNSGPPAAEVPPETDTENGNEDDGERFPSEPSERKRPRTKSEPFDKGDSE